MTTVLLFDNVVAYGLQVLAVVAAAALVLTLVRSAVPRARLAIWQAVLVLCLLLPLVQPWQAVDAEGLGTVSVEFGPVVVAAAGQQDRRSFDWRTMVLLLLAFGAAGRLLWLTVGFYRLRRYRLQAGPMELAPVVSDFGKYIATSAGFYSSGSIRSPVTFGVWRPVVLLPHRFRELEPDVQRAVVCHELLHVQRRDWLFNVAEEIVRALLWFHPAVWWLISQIQLTREQVVDREVLDWTGSRESYMEALLAISGAGAQLDLAPASLFLKKRHLNRRVEALLKEEKTMSIGRTVVCVVLLIAGIAAATWVATGAFPLVAAAQSIPAARTPGVEAPEHEPLLHGAPPRYPEAAREKRIEGQVDLEAAIDENGNVYDVRVISGPEDLRSAALRAVLEWHYSDEVPRPSKRLVTLNFRLPPASKPPPGPRPDFEVLGESLGVVEAINIDGLTEERRTALLAGLPVKVGEVLTPSRFQDVGAYLRRFDEHFRITTRPTGGEGADKTLAVRIVMPPGPGQTVEMVEAGAPKKIRVDGGLQSARLTHEVPPMYPPLARQAKVEGMVLLKTSIDEAGKVEKLEVESGHPLLVPAALDAVKQWEYNPTLLNGEPVKVSTLVTVSFTLAP